MKNLANYMLLGVVAGLLIGCNGSGSAPTIVQDDQKAVANGKQLHEMYDKAKGDFTALSPQEQAQFNKQAGGNAAAGKKLWDMMKSTDSTQQSNNNAGSKDPRVGH